MLVIYIIMGKTADLIGQGFHDLTVISREGSRNGKALWKCKCVCGVEKINTTGDLRSGQAKSCGCLRSRRSPGNIVDMKGEVYGNLTVIERDGSSEVGHALWKCKCSCGNFKSVLGRNLRRGESTSCGCRTRGSQTNGTIYGLYSKEGDLKYIGQTVRYKLEHRLKGHLQHPHGKVKDWLKEIDYTPEIKPLFEGIPIEYLSKVEEKLIRSTSKEINLLNTDFNEWGGKK